MAEREHDFKDADGYVVPIRPSADHPGAAAVLAATGFIIEPHRLAEFTRAIYAAAGQPVPDLPVIYNPATVASVVQILAGHFREDDNRASYEPAALALLDAGWRKQ